jgi:HK97 gp10 family phage protein
MANKLEIGGIEDFVELPREISAAAAPVTKAGAERGREAVRKAYPRITGRLQDGVIVKARANSDAVIAYDVESTAPYAMHYEFGTHHQRARPTFVPITNRERSAHVKAVVGIVRNAGITVTGEDA